LQPPFGECSFTIKRTYSIPCRSHANLSKLSGCFELIGFLFEILPEMKRILIDEKVIFS